MKNIQNAIINNNNFSIISTDLTGIITTFNKTAENLLGYKAYELVGKQSPAIIHDINEIIARTEELNKELKTKIEPGFLTFVAKVDETGLPDENEWTYIRKDGTKFPVSLSITALYDDSCNIYGYLGIAQDITSKKKNEENLNNSLKEIEDYKFALDQSAIFARTDNKGKIIYVNDKFCDISKYSREELLGKDHRIVNSGHHSKEFMKNLWKTIQGGNVWKGEIKNKAKDGSFYWVYTTILPFLDNEGKPYQYVAIRYDITEKKKADEEIKRFQTFFSMSSDLLCIGDFDGYFKELNSTWETIFGFTSSELMEKHYLEFVHPDDREKTSQEIGKLFESFSVSSFENRFITKAGSYKWIIWNVTPSPEEKLLYAVAHDITDLIETTHKLEKSNQELDQFAYVVSHDLKAPLRAIASLASWIEEDMGEKLEAESKEMLTLLMGRIKRMENLILGVLEYSRIGKTDTELSLINLNESVSGVIDFLSPPEKFMINVQKDLPVIRVNRVRIQQVFQNLISNAVKYNDKENGIIDISFIKKDNFFEFSVKDNGPGISPEYHEKVFKIFQTLESRDKFESTGIGLTIVKKIIEELGGNIKVSSEEGNGCSFIFTIPV